MTAAAKTKKSNSSRAAGRPLSPKRRKAATKPKFLTRNAFRNLFGKKADHPAAHLQPETFGYPIHLVHTREGTVIAAGCRWLTFAEAKTHWTGRTTASFAFSTPHTRARAHKMLALLPKLEQRARRLGWLPVS